MSNDKLKRIENLINELIGMASDDEFCASDKNTILSCVDNMEDVYRNNKASVKAI